MLKKTDLLFGLLLAIGSAGHTFGTFTFYPAMSEIWVWSLGAALAAALLAALNMVRAVRPGDTTIAAITTVGTALWALIAFAFGKCIGNLADPRVVMHFTTSVVLVGFGLRTLSARRQ